MIKSIIQIVTDQILGSSLYDLRIKYLEKERVERDPYREEEPGTIIRQPVYRYRSYFHHLETGKKYLAFSGGVSWPRFNTPGCLVVLGVGMPEDPEILPEIEVLEVSSGINFSVILEAALEIRIRYGAIKNDKVLKIWYGPENNAQAQAVERFKEAHQEDYRRLGYPIILISSPYLSEQADYYDNAVQSILEFLRSDASGRKRLVGVTRFKDLEHEIRNLSEGHVKKKLEEFPATAALCCPNYQIMR